MAGLNIGIAQSIWAINPFFISILEKVVYGTPFNFKQGYGMLALMLCAIFVSLSEVISPKDETVSVGGVIVEEQHAVPIWLAVLGSFGMPIICTLFVIVIKQANDTLKIAPYDFTMSYWLVFSIVFQLVGVLSFTKNEGSFDVWLWFNGTMASLLNMLGCMFAICCFGTGAPIGPASALIGVQSILVVIIASI